MTRDYKTTAAPRAQRGRRGSCGFWFLTGTLLGGLGVGLAWLLQDWIPPPADAPAARSETQPAAKPRFDFYNILPEMEVVVPDNELAEQAQGAKAAKPPAQPPAKPDQPPGPKTPDQQAAKSEPATDDGKSYLLQVASYRTAADAERLKAKLALLGIQAQIQRITINNKDTYHRVRAGPFSGKDAVNQARTLLNKNGLESVAVKLK